MMCKQRLQIWRVKLLYDNLYLNLSSKVYFKPGNAVKVKGVVASSPCHRALITACSWLVGLALDAQVHYVVAADGAVVYLNVPRPQRHGRPLLHFEALLGLQLGRWWLLCVHFWSELTYITCGVEFLWKNSLIIQFFKLLVI